MRLHTRKESIVSRGEQLHFSLLQKLFSLLSFHQISSSFFGKGNEESAFLCLSFLSPRIFQERKRRIRFSFSLPSNFRTCECTSRLFSETAATCKDLGGKQYGRLTNGHKLRNRVRGYEPLRRISVMPITIQWVPWLPHSLSPKKQWSRSSACSPPRQRVSFDAGGTGPGRAGLKGYNETSQNKSQIYYLCPCIPATIFSSHRFLRFPFLDSQN